MFAARKSGVRYMRENGLETCTLYFSPRFRKTQFCTQTCLYIYHDISNYPFMFNDDST